MCHHNEYLILRGHGKSTVQGPLLTFSYYYVADFQYDRVLVIDWLSEACVHSDERLTLINSVISVYVINCNFQLAKLENRASQSSQHQLDMGGSHMTVLMKKPPGQALVQSPSPCTHVPPPSMSGGSFKQNLPASTMTTSMLPSDAEGKVSADQEKSPDRPPSDYFKESISQRESVKMHFMHLGGATAVNICLLGIGSGHIHGNIWKILRYLNHEYAILRSLRVTVSFLFNIMWGTAERQKRTASGKLQPELLLSTAAPSGQRLCLCVANWENPPAVWIGGLIPVNREKNNNFRFVKLPSDIKSISEFVVHRLSPAHYTYQWIARTFWDSQTEFEEMDFKKELITASMILSKFFSQDAFGSVLPISFILSWTEIWLMDFKVLTQETEDENRSLMVQNASGRGGWLHSARDLEGGFKKKLKKNRTLRVMSVTFAECENSTLKIIEREKERGDFRSLGKIRQVLLKGLTKRAATFCSSANILKNASPDTHTTIRPSILNGTYNQVDLMASPIPSIHSFIHLFILQVLLYDETFPDKWQPNVLRLRDYRFGACKEENLAIISGAIFKLQEGRNEEFLGVQKAEQTTDKLKFDGIKGKWRNPALIWNHNQENHSIINFQKLKFCYFIADIKKEPLSRAGKANADEEACNSRRRTIKAIYKGTEVHFTIEHMPHTKNFSECALTKMTLLVQTYSIHNNVSQDQTWGKRIVEGMRSKEESKMFSVLQFPPTLCFYKKIFSFANIHAFLWYKSGTSIPIIQAVYDPKIGMFQIHKEEKEDSEKVMEEFYKILVQKVSEGPGRSMDEYFDEAFQENKMNHCTIYDCAYKLPYFIVALTNSDGLYIEQWQPYSDDISRERSAIWNVLFSNTQTPYYYPMSKILNLSKTWFSVAAEPTTVPAKVQQLRKSGFLGISLAVNMNSSRTLQHACPISFAMICSHPLPEHTIAKEEDYTLSPKYQYIYCENTKIEKKMTQFKGGGTSVKVTGYPTPKKNSLQLLVLIKDGRVEKLLRVMASFLEWSRSIAPHL
eukprot:bmy_04171T0